MRFSSSFSTRLVFLVLSMALFTFAIFYSLTYFKLKGSIERQTDQIGILSNQKVMRELDGQAKLASSLLQDLGKILTRRLEGIAQRSDVIRAVQSGNVVAINDVIGRAAKLADVDGVIVLDDKLRVVGSQAESVDLLSAHQSLHDSPFLQHIKDVLKGNNPNSPVVYEKLHKFDRDLSQIMDMEQAHPLSFVSIVPLFDDFGEVMGAFVAHRFVRSTESKLTEFSGLERTGIVLQSDTEIVSSAGVSAQVGYVSQNTISEIRLTSDGRHIARCVPFFSSFEVCSVVPLNQLYELRNELVRIGEAEGQALSWWLLAAAGISLVLFAVVTFMATLRLVRPLENITGAVRNVSMGDWKTSVLGTERSDEIGDIARAVVLMQNSMEERDKLKIDVANAEVLNKRREELEDSIHKFGKMMRSVLLNVSDCVDSLESTAQELERVSAIAEGEAAEVAFVTDNTLENIRKLAHITTSLEHEVDEARAQFHSVHHDVLSQQNALMGEFGQLSNDASAAPLQGIVQGLQSGQSAATIHAFASQISVMMENHIEKLAHIEKRVLGHEMGTGALQGELSALVEQTRSLVESAKKHDFSTRVIAHNVEGAVKSSTNVASSVQRLRVTLEDTRDVTARVVHKAGEMAEEAHRLDLTVKSFLREVAA